MAERKRYIEVEIPSLSTSFRVLGTKENLPNKTIRLDMSRKMKGKGLIATFRLFNRDDKLIAIPNKLELGKSYIKKMMRKRVDYVEDSFQTKCADVVATIKPFLITRKKVSRAVRRNLRNTAREFISEYLKERDFYTVSSDIFSSTLQKAMLPKLKKVYPLSFCEIRVLHTKEIDNVSWDSVSKNIEEEQEEEKAVDEGPAKDESTKEEEQKDDTTDTSAD